MTVASDGRPDRAARRAAAPMRQDEDVLDTWFSSQLWPFATLRLARARPARRLLLSDERALDRARHPVPVGRAHGHERHVLRRRPDALRRRHHPPHGLQRRGQADEQVARHRRRPARPDGALRRRRHALRPHAAGHRRPGHQVLRGEARLEPQLREQDLEREPLRAHEPRGLRAGRAGCRTPSPTAGSSRGSRTSRRAWTRGSTPTSSARSPARSTTSSGTSSATGTSSSPRRAWPQGGEARASVQRNLVFVLDQALRLLHPMMPFVTEAIWRNLPLAEPSRPPSLMVAAWPDAARLAALRRRGRRALDLAASSRS